jgi:hypothetical protein
LPLASDLKRLRRAIPSSIRIAVRRQADHFLPNPHAREYRDWMRDRLRIRQNRYNVALQRGLLSILTPVWDGSPLRYFRPLAESIIGQNAEGACEWVVLDNGCSDKRLLAYFDELRTHRWIKFVRSDRNLGITKGLRHCLESATAQYVLPVDADDYLYPDALRVTTAFILRRNYPALLYSDEDKIIGGRFFQPYLKPDWDPVLLLNSAYIAHLGIVDRKIAIRLGAYTDPTTEASPDWDLFVRFMMAGYESVHIPEILYSWRVHARSSAGGDGIKAKVDSSQRAVLQRFLDGRPDAPRFAVEYSPLIRGTSHWRFTVRRDRPQAFASVIIGSGAQQKASADFGGECTEISKTLVDAAMPAQNLRSFVAEAAKQKRLILLLGHDVVIEDPAWPWEVLALLDLHAGAVMVGGRIRNRRGLITEAGRYFGFDGPCGCPNRGRSFLDPGYFAQMWKQRSVSAVSSQFAVAKPEFLLRVLDRIPTGASTAYLGAWAGAHAARNSARIIYTPFLSGISQLDWDTLISSQERDLFASQNYDLIPDRRFYSPLLSLEEPFKLRKLGYELAQAAAR